jgi:hypothetical protein
MTQDDRDEVTCHHATRAQRDVLEHAHADCAESNRAAFTQAPRVTSTPNCFAAAKGLPGSQVNR